MDVATVMGVGPGDSRARDRRSRPRSPFIVSPGLTESLGRAVVDHKVAFLPGATTAGDVMRGLDMGLTHFKSSPAMAAGGVPALKALCAPLNKARFCPTGGITPDTAADRLAILQVLCIGGSWVVPPGVPDSARIHALARAACELDRARATGTRCGPRRMMCPDTESAGTGQR